jgi:hypothetical protein
MWECSPRISCDVLVAGLVPLLRVYPFDLEELETNAFTEFRYQKMF